MSKAETMAAFRNDCAVLKRAILHNPGENMRPWFDNTPINMLNCESWQNKLSEATQKIEGLDYKYSRLNESRIIYTNFGSMRMESRVSRALSFWHYFSIEKMSQELKSFYGIPDGALNIVVTGPTLDGIGFSLGVQRRKDGISPYSTQAELNIAVETAKGGFRIGMPESKPDPGTYIYQYAKVPGPYYEQDGKTVRQRVVTEAFANLGIMGTEMELENDRKASIYGRTLYNDGNSIIESNQIHNFEFVNLITAVHQQIELNSESLAVPLNRYWLTEELR